ncbi:MAG: hypothetical protein Q7U47_06725 [Paludibacter sp.]|nr:hypothetical protein [Paludibacter sp.]
MSAFLRIFFASAIITVVLITTACKRSSKPVTVSNKNNYQTIDTVLVNQENQTIAAFRSFVDSLENTDVTSALLATDYFKMMFAGQSKGLCDTAYVIFQELMDTILVKQNERLETDTTDFSPFVSGEKTGRKINDFRGLLQKNGFSLRSSEGMVYIQLNYNYLIQHFSALVSEPMIEYLTEINIEHKEGFADDAAIIITPEKHVDRVIWYENFISKYPTFILIDNCKKYHKAYFTYLLNGFNNTTLFTSTESHELSNYFAKAYSYLIKKYPDSETTLLTLPYYEALKKKQIAEANELLKKYLIKGLVFNLH